MNFVFGIVIRELYLIDTTYTYRIYKKKLVGSYNFHFLYLKIMSG